MEKTTETETGKTAVRAFRAGINLAFDEIKSICCHACQKKITTMYVALNLEQE